MDTVLTYRRTCAPVCESGQPVGLGRNYYQHKSCGGSILDRTPLRSRSLTMFSSNPTYPEIVHFRSPPPAENDPEMTEHINTIKRADTRSECGESGQEHEHVL